MNRSLRAFTLIEVTLAAALALTLLALVVVRFNWGGSRQAAIDAARRLGFQISGYRERARGNETLFALRLDIANGTYSMLEPANRTATALATAPVLHKAVLSAPLSFKQVLIQGKTQTGIATVYFDDRGLLPDLSIDIANGQEGGVILKVDSVINEIEYAEH